MVHIVYFIYEIFSFIFAKKFFGCKRAEAIAVAGSASDLVGAWLDVLFAVPDVGLITT